MVLEKTLESPLDCKEIQPVHSEGDQPWDFFGRNDAEVKLQYFGHLMRRVDSLEKTVMLGGIGGGRRRGRQRIRCQPVHSKGDQPWVFFGRNDAKAETPVLWPSDAKC